MSDIDLPPEAPAIPSRRNDQQMAFDIKTEAYLGWQETFRTWLVSFREWLIGLRTSVFEAAASVSQSEINAAASAAAASAAAGATKWAPGNYAEGAVVWSPSNGLLYRRKSTGASAVDPASATPEAAAQWWLMGAPLAAPIQYITGNADAQVGMHYVIGAALTLTLPPDPAVRDVVQITDLSASRAAIIVPGANLIRGQAGNLTLNLQSARVALVYSGSTNGWI